MDWIFESYPVIVSHAAVAWGGFLLGVLLMCLAALSNTRGE